MEKIFKLYTQRDRQKNCFRYDSEYNTLQAAIDAGLRWINEFNYREQQNCNFYVETEEDGVIHILKEVTPRKGW